MSRTIKVAVVGAGYFSQFHFDAWRRIPDVEVVAICDAKIARAQARQVDFPGADVFADATKMLDRARPDLLDIVTPPETHFELVALGAARGAAMICQKPLAPTYGEAERIVETAERAGVLLVAHENFRFMPWYREASRLLREGALGRPLAISFRLRPGDGQGPQAYLDRQPYFQQMRRFLIHETAIHFIDTFRYLMGEVSGVFARLRRINPAIAGEDAGYVLFEFASGAAGMFDGNRHVDHRARDMRLTMGTMLLEGANAVLRLDGDGRLWLKPRGGEERAHPCEWMRLGFGGDCVRALQAHVVAHLRGSQGIENDGRSYLRNIAIEEAVYRSHAEGRWIATPVAPGGNGR
ncbi:MAG TPA: Gfo/Idh/MocA family oxidoreductase [Alphaproteobacteria bacterium]|nr:Gfo/Idh/MocA family oxidoreductase [Alphaproteobacteria bacterium]